MDELRSGTLGYHRPGDYHYFLQTPTADRMKGAGDTSYHEPAQFIGFVTTVHEHFHLVQSMTSGYCWWLGDVEDRLVESVVEAVRSQAAGGRAAAPLWQRPAQAPTQILQDGTALTAAITALYERDMVTSMLQLPRFTGQLVRAEYAGAPLLEAMFAGEAHELTTMDLLETQAAINTAIAVQGRVQSQPDQFDVEVVQEHWAGIVEPSSMAATYGRALRVLRQILETVGLDLRPQFDRVTATPALQNEELYLLCSYLIQYALHLPPEALPMRSWFDNDGAVVQDLYPPFRFLSLATMLAFELVTAPAAGRRLLDPDNLFSVTDARLAEAVNSAHDQVRSVDHHRAAAAGHRFPASFFSMADTADRWEAWHGSRPARATDLPALHALQDRCVAYTRTGGSTAFTSGDLLGFHTAVGLPIFDVTPRGIRVFPYFTREAEAADDAAAMRHARTMMDELGRWRMWDYTERYPITAVPWPFVSQVLDRGMMRAAAVHILAGEPARCPLTIGVGASVDCDHRTSRCTRIALGDPLPESGCRFREIIERYFEPPQEDG